MHIYTHVLSHILRHAHTYTYVNTRTNVPTHLLFTQIHAHFTHLYSQPHMYTLIHIQSHTHMGSCMSVCPQLLHFSWATLLIQSPVPHSGSRPWHLDASVPPQSWTPISTPGNAMLSKFPRHENVPVFGWPDSFSDSGCPEPRDPTIALLHFHF